ncbi:hypothetical protein MBLNU457_g2616t1 [Dothideomycetes sp. NU457]
MDKPISASRAKASRKSTDSNSNDKSPNSALPIRSERPAKPKRQSSATSTTRSKKPRLRPGANRRASSVSPKLLQPPATDDIAITSGDESNYPESLLGDNKTPTKSRLIRESDPESSPLKRPSWTVRHRIYLDNALLSTTTSTQRAGYHKFADFLLREQIETRLYSAQNGHDAHFATRHAVLRFWRRDGTLGEKWMDKDYGGEREHEFAMENMNDWTILHLAMGGEEQTIENLDGEELVKEDAAEDRLKDETMSDDPPAAVVVEDVDAKEADETPEQDESGVYPTMDITSHYLSSYFDARNISSAPGNASSTHSGEGKGEGEDEEEEEMPTYHWVEERRRDLEHQLRSYYHCTLPHCYNRGGTCLVPGAQHLHVGVKDLTDWSQQIAHANRSIAATTLHLAAKLIDDQTRAQDERLADIGRERDDEDDLGLTMEVHPILEEMRPSQGDAVDLDPLD